jgi:hypothetical protein
LRPAQGKKVTRPQLQPIVGHGGMPVFYVQRLRESWFQAFLSRNKGLPNPISTEKSGYVGTCLSIKLQWKA